jgi:hypothetical protein
MFRVIAPIGLLVMGCQASTSARVSGTAQGNVEANTSADVRGESAEDAPKLAGLSNSSSFPRDEDATAAEDSPKALFGARAGLHLASPTSANCQCLAVVVGQPNDGRFVWTGQPSSIDPTTQIAVALGSDGLDCPSAPRGTLGASYHGYSVEGQDVVISVESGKLGRPVTHGAILPRPVDGGRVLVRPVDARTPYGRALDGNTSRCVVPAFVGTQ